MRLRLNVRQASIGGWLTLALCGGLLAPLAASAQEATPVAGSSPVAAGEAFVSPTREQVEAGLKAAFATDEAPANRDGTYIVGAISDLQSVNPLLVESDPSITVVGLIFEGLLGADPRTGEPTAGGLTDSYEIAPDGVTYTFHLSTTAKWQDGQDVTADDVQFSAEALADEATKSAYTGSFNGAVASFKALDPDTFQIVAKEKRFTFLYDVQTLYIVPKHIWGAIPHDQWKTNEASTGLAPAKVVGSGPFKFESWTQGQEVRLTRNNEFHGVKPAFKQYVFREFPDAESQFNAFLIGEIDVLGLEPAQVKTVEGTSGLKWTSYPDRGFTYYEFNLNSDTTTLFKDVEVRQAMLFALDRKSIVDNILLGYGEVAKGTQPKLSYAYAPDELSTDYVYNPDKAKQLLAAAGWVDSNGDGTVDKKGQELKFDFLYASGSATNDSMVAYMQDAWKTVGIAMTPKPLEFSALIEATTTKLDWQIALYGFSWDASFLQDAMFGCDQYQVGFNDMKYCNPELDKIFVAAKQEFDQTKRRALMIKAADIVNQEQPIGVVNFAVGLAGSTSRVHNYHPSAWGNQSYIGVWVDA